MLISEFAYNELFDRILVHGGGFTKGETYVIQLTIGSEFIWHFIRIPTGEDLMRALVAFDARAETERLKQDP